jgi:putative pyruvate formate lyase activating enzyme
LYLALSSGELEARAARLEARLASCDICPRQCRVNRLNGELGFCCSGRLPIVASYCAHRGEEPAISGRRGSGAIFFANCNLRCVFCQNYQISQDSERWRDSELDPSTLAGYMLALQNQGCHNINLVSPSHFVPQIVRALTLAVPRGLCVPIVYNTNAYDSLATLSELDGIVDIYLPDLKYASDEVAHRLSGAPDYVGRAREAIKEMYRQVGNLVIDEGGVAVRGVIVRHLILPGGLAGSRESLTWLAHEVSPDITVSLMSQYHPTHQASRFPEISRPISSAEYAAAIAALDKAGLENGWAQEMGTEELYLPDFEREGHPFGG